MNKSGHSTANIPNKGHFFYMYWAQCFDLLKQIANTLNYPVYEQSQIQWREVIFFFMLLNTFNARIFK